MYIRSISPASHAEIMPHLLINQSGIGVVQEFAPITNTIPGLQRGVFDLPPPHGFKLERPLKGSLYKAPRQVGRIQPLGDAGSFVSLDVFATLHETINICYGMDESADHLDPEALRELAANGIYRAINGIRGRNGHGLLAIYAARLAHTRRRVMQARHLNDVPSRLIK